MPLPGSSPSECPQKGSVICGEANCEYTSFCEASSFFKKEECSPLVDVESTNELKCPDGDPICPHVHDPVVCAYEGQSCRYNNMCRATSMDGINETMCAPLNTVTEDTSTPEVRCPVDIEDSDAMCPEVVDAVVCAYEGQSCRYDNMCKAVSMVGINETICQHTNAVVNDNDVLSADDISKETDADIDLLFCPDGTPPDGAVMCDSEEPVSCGPTLCFYNNACEAEYDKWVVRDECILEKDLIAKTSNDLGWFT